MKSLLIIILLLPQILILSQEDNNWRLFPGKEMKVKPIAATFAIDSTEKKLNYNTPDGKINISQPASIDSLTNKHKRSSYILGYTVQLEVSQQTSRIRDARYRLLKIQPNAPIEEIYAAPNTYLYGGAFYTRTDAYEFKNSIKSYFPNAIIISKKLKLPPIQSLD